MCTACAYRPRCHSAARICLKPARQRLCRCAPLPGALRRDMLLPDVLKHGVTEVDAKQMVTTSLPYVNNGLGECVASWSHKSSQCRLVDGGGGIEGLHGSCYPTGV
eukprot:365081-Chlamydomonas_euryale.AAC.7